MTKLAPSPLAFVPFVSVEDMMRLVNALGIETVLIELADAIEADFMRWPDFDKTPRVASHSREGVIELMPTAVGQQLPKLGIVLDDNDLRHGWLASSRGIGMACLAKRLAWP